LELLKEKKKKRKSKFMEMQVKFQINYSKNKFNDLDIPITIYTPIDVKKDKMVVYFHGGGKKQGFLFS
jgi:acetyl esterase/lipase